MKFNREFAFSRPIIAQRQSRNKKAISPACSSRKFNDYFAGASYRSRCATWDGTADISDEELTIPFRESILPQSQLRFQTFGDRNEILFSRCWNCADHSTRILRSREANHDAANGGDCCSPAIGNFDCDGSSDCNIHARSADRHRNLATSSACRKTVHAGLADLVGGRQRRQSEAGDTHAAEARAHGHRHRQRR